MSASATAEAGALRQRVAVIFEAEKHCGGRRRSDDINGAGRAGQPCRLARGHGTSHLGSGHCKYHGGASPSGKTEAVAEAAAQALAKLGVAVQIDPQEALLQMVREAWGNVIFLRERARAFGLELVGDVIDAVRDGDSYATYASSEEVRAIVRLYGEWADRLVKYSKACIDAGIAEARLELEREAVDVLFAAVTAGLDAAGVTKDQRDRALKATVAQLRRVEARPPVGVERN